MAHINQNYFTPSNKKQIFEIFSEVNYKLKQLGSIHTGGMTLFFNDKSKEPKWHISIGSDNDGYTLIYSEFSDKENKWIRKDEQTCEYFNDALSILKSYRKKLDNLGFEKALPQKAIYFKYAIYDRSNSSYVNWYLTKTNEFNYFYCPQGSDYYEMRKLFLNSLVLFDTAEEAKEYVYQNKKDIISKNTVDIIQIKIEDESHYHFGRKSIIHIKNYNEDINEYDMEIDGIDLYYNNNIIGQLGTAKDHKYNGEVALVSNLSKRFIQSVMHYLYSTLRGVKWEKPTILSSPIEDKYFGYNPNDIYTDDIDVVYGSKTIGYCGTKNRNFTGEIRFKDGVNENLKKAVLYKFNNSSLYNDVEWKEVEKMKESIESKLAESFASELKNLQKEGLFENVSSFDLNFNGKGINIKLNEGYPAYRKDSPKLRDANADVDEVLANNLAYKYLKQAVKSFDAVAGKSDTFKYYVGKHIEYSLPKVIGSWMAKIDIKDEACRLEIAVGYDYDDSDNIQVLIGIYRASNGVLRPSTRRILTTVGLKPAVLGLEDGNDSRNFDVNGLVDTAPISGFVFMSESIPRVTTILRNLKKKLDLVNRSWNDNFAQNEKEYYVKKGLISSRDLNDARKKRLKSIEKNAKRDAAHRYESFKRVSNLRENESDESKYPFTDLIVDYMNRYYDVCDFWPALRSISESAFYDEVSEETGMDYDDVKDCCWDMVPDIPPLNEMFNKLVYLGSEKYLSEKYGTLKNLQKVIDKDNAETEAACEEFANRFDSLYDEEDLENEYKEAVDYAVADLEARFNRDDDDDDDD